MKKIIILLSVFPAVLLSSPMEFSKPIPVMNSGGKKIFIHLDSSGRKNIAVSSGYTAVVWEDNSRGKPHVYAAYKKNNRQEFSKPVQLSQSESYEPVISHFSNDSFIAAWEENEQIRVCIISYKKNNRCIFTGKMGSAQPSLADGNASEAHLVWSSREGDHSRIYYTAVHEYKGNPVTAEAVAVDAGSVKARQAYPAVASGKARIMIVWEDQRTGNTVIFSSEKNAAGGFTQPVPVNEIIKKSQAYGEAQGTARPVVEYFKGKNRFIAVWLDKREFHAGYEVFGAYADSGILNWSRNFKIQDPFGDGVPQWHSTAAVLNSGNIAAFWDDTREGSSDVWYSLFDTESVSEDITHPSFSGNGNQTSPSVTVDEKGYVHLIYLDHQKNGRTGIQYVKGYLKR